jgi:hypothetical protein
MAEEKTTFDPASKNVLYDTFSPAWELSRDFSEMHEHILREGTYLDQFGHGTDKAEPTAQYNLRKQSSFAMDYCGELIDLRLGNLFRSRPVRRYDDSQYKDFIDEFIKDVDGGGTSMDEFMADVARKHYSAGLVDVVVDKTNPGVDTDGMNAAQEAGLGVRVILNSFTPLERVDWASDFANNYKWVRYSLGASSPDDETEGFGDDQYVTFTPDEWRLYNVGGDIGTTVEYGPMVIGRLPITQLWYGKSQNPDYRGIPISLLTRIAPIARDLLNLVSQGQLDLYMSLGILAVFGIKDDELPEYIASGSWVAFPSEEGKIEAIRPEVDHIKEKREWINLYIMTILRLGKLIGASGSVESSATSGFHAEVERTDLDNEIEATAEKMEALESEVIALAISRETGTLVSTDDINYSVDYNRKYTTTPITELLNHAEKLFKLDLGESTPGLYQAALRKLADKMLSPTDSTREQVLAEIDNADFGMVSEFAKALPVVGDGEAPEDG